MAAASGTQDTHVTERTDPASEARYGLVLDLLEEVPFEFDFFQSVRLFDRCFPSRKPVGRKFIPAAEVMRFSAHASVVFPASAIQRIEWNTSPPTVVINFMGLTGPQGVLPLLYTHLIIERIKAKDPGMAAFFDIFNHRMISLFYRAWEKSRFAIAYERRDPEERDPVTRVLMHVIGIGTEGLQTRQAVPDEMVTTFSLAGTPDDARERIAKYWTVADSITLSPPTAMIDIATQLAYQQAIAETFWRT